MQWFFRWLEIHTGVANGGPDPYYNFWSGFGSDLSEIALVGALVTVARHHNCGTKGCWRIGRHDYRMGQIVHKLCRKHHPHHSGEQVTAQEIEDHAGAQSHPNPH